MPSKKKKKPVANPARGFATVSLPSKAKGDTSTVHSDVSTTPQESLPDINSTSLGPDDGSQERGNENVAITAMTPEALEKHLEDAELQSILDVNSMQVKSDVKRQVLRLDAERRTLRLNANKLSTSIWMHEQLVNEITKTYRAELENYSRPTLKQVSTTSEADLTIRVWTLQRILISLGLPQVEEALLHVLRITRSKQLHPNKDYTWGLREAFEWIATDDDAAPHMNYESGGVETFPEPRFSNESRPESPVWDHVVPLTTVRENNKVSPNMTSEPDVNEVGILRETEWELDDDDNDPTKLLEKWIRLKTTILRIEHLKSHDRDCKHVDSSISKLQRRMATIESDILFDSYEAEQAWRVMLPQKFIEIQIEIDQALKLAGQIPPMPSNGDTHEFSDVEKSSNGEVKLRAEEPSDEERNLPPNHTEDSDLFGDIFAATEAAESTSDMVGDPESEATIHLVDFGKWNGLHPRRILEEACKSRDRKSKIQISLLRKTAHSFRHQLVIDWSAEQTPDEWLSASLPSTVWSHFSTRKTKIQMRGIAASTELQSESYVSTIALFSMSLITPGQQKTNLRLPPVWRDLWQQLIQSRQKVIDDADKSDLRRVRCLIEQAMEATEKDQSIPSRSFQGIGGVQSGGNEFRSVPEPSSSADIKALWVAKTDTLSFNRMLTQRAQLPISAYRQEILETVQNHSITILSAETGAGKSTQIPSFILESEMISGRDCRIIVTQPRRISAITLARRVSQELGEATNDLGTRRSLVGYSIRLESKVSRTTRITFATTGVLLRMLEQSANLEEANYLILDEVHERTMDLDLLFIAVRHLIIRRPTIKVVLMSATVDSQKFARYFGDAPVVNVPGRTFPVKIGYLEEAMAAVGKTSSSNIDPQDVAEDHTETAAKSDADNSRELDFAFTNSYEYQIDYDLITRLIVALATKPEYLIYSKAILVFLPGIGEIRRLFGQIGSEPVLGEGWIVHMLHSSFSSEDLEQAFMIPPKGVRKIVIATNIAETGITIPDVTAVIDSCKEKIMRFDDRRQMSKLSEGFISRAASRQRRGRAARVQEGLCFHLVSKVRYDTLMLEQQVPEMLRLSLQDPILRVKIWNLGDIEETLAQALDPPTQKNIRRAIDALKDAGALTTNELLTPLGRQVARLPLDVSLGKLAILGVALRSLEAAISIAAILSSKSPFIVSSRQQGNFEATAAKIIFSRGNSDLLTVYSAYLGWRKATVAGAAFSFCRKHKLSSQVLSQIEEQKLQLLIQLVEAGLLQFTDAERISLRQARLSSSRRNTSFAIPERYNSLSDTDDSGICATIAAAFYPKLLIRQGKGWRNVTSNQIVSLHPSSVNKANPQPPRWLSFYEAISTKSGTLNALETTAVPEAAIVTLLGEAEFKIHAGVISLDGGRVRFAVREWRTMLALKVLREKVKAILEKFYRNARVELGEEDEKWLRIWRAAIQTGERAGVVA